MYGFWLAKVAARYAFKVEVWTAQCGDFAAEKSAAVRQKRSIQAGAAKLRHIGGDSTFERRQVERNVSEKCRSVARDSRGCPRHGIR